ncbi:MAG TPA: hypothetical protein VKD90_26990, partial [Gemmataceae bacterium]|nr:hypothetical protein [Gemmataceae bacterium]
MPGPVTATFGSWASPITSDLIAAASVGLHDVLLDGDTIYWVEGRPQEAGRYVLVRRNADGTSADVNPPPINARTRVHEYGGGGAVVAGGVAYVSNFRDQRLYRIAPGAAPEPMTPAPPDPNNPDVSLRYADGRIDTARGLWVGVREDHLDRAREAVNTVVAVPLPGGGPGTVLVKGNDFYSSPRLSPDGKQLAWLCWNHPNMPWVGTELWVAAFDGGAIANATKVAGGPAESVFQPEWAPDGRLYFVSDKSGWWNLYRRESDGTVAAICPRSAEFGQPAWTFGISTYAFLSDREAVCSYVEGLGRLARLDLSTGTLTPLDLPYTEFGAVRAGGGKVVFRGGSGTTPAAVVALDPGSGATSVLRSATPDADLARVKPYLTAPTPITFPTAGG